MPAPKLSWWDRFLMRRGRIQRDTMSKMAAYQSMLVCRSCGHEQIWHETVALIYLTDPDRPGVMKMKCGYSGETYDPDNVCGCVVEGKLSELFEESK